MQFIYQFLTILLFYFLLLYNLFSTQQLWKERGEDEDDKPDNQYNDGFARTTFPLFKQDAPDVWEGNVERHKDAESKSEQRGRTF